MSNEIARREVAPMSFEEMNIAAKAMAASRVFPGWDTPEKILSLMLICREENPNPAVAVMRYENIQGRIAKKASAMLEDFIAYGGKVKWHQCDAKCCSATFVAPGDSDGVKLEYNWQEVVSAGLHMKDNYKKYPTDMLRSRLISRAMRMICPKATGLFYAPEELDGIQPEKQSAPTMVAASVIFGGGESKQEENGKAMDVAAEVIKEAEIQTPQPLPQESESFDNFISKVNKEKAIRYFRSIKFIKDDQGIEGLTKSQKDKILAKLDSVLAKITEMDV
jgi:hypothetical protein